MTARASTTDTAWYQLDADAALEQLDSTRDGLSDREAEQRLATFGPNELEDRGGRSSLQIFLSQFRDLFTVILIVAAAVSAFLEDWIEAVAILAIIVLNAAMGFVQEKKAEEAMAALKRMSVPEVTLVRSGQAIVTTSRDIVPGDVLVLETGNIIPADGRLVEAVNLDIEEAPLTGESVPVSKDAERVYRQEVPVADRDPTRDQEAVALEAPFDHRPRLTGLVASYPEERDRVEPGGLQPRREGGAVGVPDLPRQHRLAGRDQFASRRQDRHARPRDDREFPEPGGGSESCLGGAEPRARTQHDVALSNVLAPAGDVRARPDAFREAHAPLGSAGRGHLLDGHRVCAGGDHGSGEDAHALAGADLDCGFGAGGENARDREFASGFRQVGRADRVAVHRSPVEGRQVSIGDRVLGQEATRDAAVEPRALDTQRRDAFERDPQRFFEGDHRRGALYGGFTAGS